MAHKESFNWFEYEAHRVDEFLSVYLIRQKKYALVYNIFQYVCVLSHGQASIERGFNINKDVVEHLANESLVAQRLVYDRIK